MLIKGFKSFIGTIGWLFCPALVVVVGAAVVAEDGSTGRIASPELALGLLSELSLEMSSPAVETFSSDSLLDPLLLLSAKVVFGSALASLVVVDGAIVVVKACSVRLSQASAISTNGCQTLAFVLDISIAPSGGATPPKSSTEALGGQESSSPGSTSKRHSMLCRQEWPQLPISISAVIPTRWSASENLYSCSGTDSDVLALSA
mmetsp:Transcript_50751/g.91118  ORF Transcript_50751/g.91118 Transcript_50751/m.91118 type:complete len:204 (+) Transcript_50751:2978-3589(+)